jgi:tRNA A-37 threonylcarbamoyl transferase component Bud32/tetratricopeptide (TPR) repeat protein
VVEVADTLAPDVADRIGADATIDAVRGVSEAGRPRAMFGRYLVLERLGRGAMGEVFAAYDPDLDRKIALKRLRLADDDDRRRSARLLAEAQAMAKVRHPNVVTVFDVGEADGEIFVAMELIDGATLREWLATSHAVAEIVRVFADAARGLAAAHERGLVHRDFKPDNAMIDRSGRVQVVDFGLAGSTADRSIGIAGSPAYMAPELLEGAPATAASDQFAWCVSLFEALFGTRPFEGATLPELGSAIATGRITLPDAPRRAPRWLVAAVRRGLSVRPEDRWPSMEPLIALLERHAAASTGRRIRVAGSVLAAVTVAAIVWTRPTPVRCEDGATQIEATWNPARSTSLGQVLAEGRDPIGATRWPVIEAELTRRAGQWQAAWRDACRLSDDGRDDALGSRRRACLDEQAKTIDATLVVLEGGDPEVVARIDDVVGGLPEPEQCTAADVAEPLVDATTRSRGRRLVATVTALRVGGKYGAAIDAMPDDDDDVWNDPEIAAELTIERARAQSAAGGAWGVTEQLDRAYLAARRTDNRRLMLELADAYAAISAAEDRPRDGLVWIERARVEARRLGDTGRLAHLDGREAALRADLGEFDAAVSLAQAALSELERAGGAQTHRAIELLLNLGTYHFAAGRTAAALEHKQLAWDRAEVALDADHPLRTAILMDLGVIATRIGDTKLARVHLDEALRRNTRAYAEPNLRIADARVAIGNVAMFEERYADALAEYERALANYLPLVGEQMAGVALVRNNMSIALWKLGRKAEATEQLRRSIATKAAILPADHPDVALSYENLAEQLADVGDLGGAAAAGDVALAIRERRDEPERLVAARTKIADVLSRAGSHARAAALAEQVLAMPAADDKALAIARRVIAAAESGGARPVPTP